MWRRRPTTTCGPENQAEAVIDREKVRALNRPDVEAKVASGELAFGNAKEVTERLIEQAEAVGANKLLINVNFGAMPNDLFMEQVRRFGRDVLPKLQAHQVTRIPADGERCVNRCGRAQLCVVAAMLLWLGSGGALAQQPIALGAGSRFLRSMAGPLLQAFRAAAARGGSRVRRWCCCMAAPACRNDGPQCFRTIASGARMFAVRGYVGAGCRQRRLARHSARPARLRPERADDVRRASEGCLCGAAISPGAAVCARRPHRRDRLVAGRRDDPVRDRRASSGRPEIRWRSRISAPRSHSIRALCSERLQSRPFVEAEPNSWTTAIPLLVLQGEADNWTPAAPCEAFMAAAKQRGAPVEFKLYPDAHHVFDAPNMAVHELRGLPVAERRRSRSAGTEPMARADAIPRAIEFFERHLLD